MTSGLLPWKSEDYFLVVALGYEEANITRHIDENSNKPSVMALRRS